MPRGHAVGDILADRMIASVLALASAETHGRVDASEGTSAHAWGMSWRASW
jgi:hypothetical protein